MPLVLREEPSLSYHSSLESSDIWAPTLLLSAGILQISIPSLRLISCTQPFTTLNISSTESLWWFIQSFSASPCRLSSNYWSTQKLFANQELWVQRRSWLPVELFWNFVCCCSLTYLHVDCSNFRWRGPQLSSLFLGLQTLLAPIFNHDRSGSWSLSWPLPYKSLCSRMELSV